MKTRILCSFFLFSLSILSRTADKLQKHHFSSYFRLLCCDIYSYCHFKSGCLAVTRSLNVALRKNRAGEKAAVATETRSSKTGSAVTMYHSRTQARARLEHCNTVTFETRETL